MPVFKVVTKYSTKYHGEIPEYKYHDELAVHDVLEYVTRPGKAAYIGGFSVNPDMAEEQFEIIARNYGKDYGIRVRHMVLSFAKWEKVDFDTAKNIAFNIAAYYGDEYQIVYAIHTDSRCLNIHFVINPISYKTGKKYDGKKEDYYQFLAYAARILDWYGLKLNECRDK